MSLRSCRFKTFFMVFNIFILEWENNVCGPGICSEVNKMVQMNYPEQHLARIKYKINEICLPCLLYGVSEEDPDSLNGHLHNQLQPYSLMNLVSSLFVTVA